MNIKAYIAEIIVNGEAAYMGRGGVLQSVPYFWRTAGPLKDRLRERQFSWRGFKAHMEPNTTVIAVSDLQKGMKGSSARRMTLDEFRSFTPGKSTTGDMPGAKYKLGKVMDNGATAFAVGEKTWFRAGDLRSHLFYNPSRLRRYITDNYIVFEVTYEPDGIMPHTVNRVRIPEFLNRSTIYAKKLAEFNRGSASVAVAPGFMDVAEKVL